MKIYCISWKDERWSADKESLNAMNKMINKNTKTKNNMQFLLFIPYSIGFIYHGFISFTKWLAKKLYRLFNTLLYVSIIIVSSGCSGAWVWQEDYPKHRTMSLKCPRWNYNEAYDELHHVYTTRQHEPIKIKDQKK